jgi:hypothetical protein
MLDILNHRLFCICVLTSLVLLTLDTKGLDIIKVRNVEPSWLFCIFVLAYMLLCFNAWSRSRWEAPWTWRPQGRRL